MDQLSRPLVLGGPLAGVEVPAERRRGLDVERGAVSRDGHRRSEPLGALRCDPFRVKLVRHVREEHLSGTGAAGVVTGLRGRQMAPDPGSLGPRQRCLDHQEVGVAGELDERIVGAAVGPEGDPAPSVCRTSIAKVRM